MQARSPFRRRIQRALQFYLTFIFATLFMSPAAQAAQKTDQNSIATAKEKKAEEEVLKLVETVRQQIGLPKLSQIHDSRLREDACESAKRGKGTGSLYPLGPTKIWIPSGVLGDVGNLSTFSYMVSDPSRTTPDLQTWATQTTYWGGIPHRFAVGVCFVTTTEHPEGTYWIDVGFYMGAIKTFLYRATFMWD
jgi:hypothetical protein